MARVLGSMHLRPLAVVGFIVACAGASQTPTSTPSEGAAFKQLEIAWDFGPCPNDGRSCHQALTVSSDGGYVATEDGTKRFAALEQQEIREMQRIVTPEFVAKLGSFSCAPEADATIRIDVDGKKQEVGGCVHAGTDSPPRALVELLARHRFSAKAAPTTRPQVPTGAGDPCTSDVGCGKGLVCAISPCVVAPCTSGNCQRTQ
jgi:hypothetical protein